MTDKTEEFLKKTNFLQFDKTNPDLNIRLAICGEEILFWNGNRGKGMVMHHTQAVDFAADATSEYYKAMRCLCYCLNVKYSSWEKYSKDRVAVVAIKKVIEQPGAPAINRLRFLEYSIDFMSIIEDNLACRIWNDDIYHID